MRHQFASRIPVWISLLALPLAANACVWRTEHKVETVHKIDAHIVLDIRQQVMQNEEYVRGDEANATAADPTAAPAPADKPEPGPTSFAFSAELENQLAERSWLTWLSWLDPTPGAAAQEVEPDEPFAKPSDEDKAALTEEENRAALQRRKERSKELEKLLTAGQLGENDRGYVVSRLPKETKKEVRQPVEALARAENADRRIIYRFIDQQQRKDESVMPAVEGISAQAIREALKPGQWFQAPRDKQWFKTFQASKLGKHYPDAKPGAWLERVKTEEK